VDPGKTPVDPGKLPEIKPSTELPAEPMPEPVTTAALGSDQVSINVFGDRFGSSSGSFRTNCGCFDTFSFPVPNPGAGGVVGRQKISEDLNPMPRDRLIFNYDYFSDTPLTANGQDVRRYVLGFEKTFFNQMTSVEFRVPFASTLSSDILAGSENTQTELGNIRFLLKGLLYTSPTLNISTGLGFYLPTGQDTNVTSSTGESLVHIDNRSVILSPFVGVLFTPTPRLFGQIWFSWDFDTNGCPVDITNATFTGLQPAGRINDQTLMQADIQLGYWILQPGQTTGLVRGLAPFLELHYGTTLTDADSVQANGFLLTNLDNRIDEFNISAGFATLMSDNLMIMFGAAAPLRQDSDKGFDYQIGFRASYYFGPTAAQRRATSLVPSF
jgi:hypothetical protein